MGVLNQVALALLDPFTLLLIVAGTGLGVFFGAVPGLSGAIGVALLVPVTFTLSPQNGLLMLGGIYMGSHYGGAISAILLNAPGDVVAACTAIEGYPMSKQGRAKEALYTAILSCVVGGFVGVLVLILFTPLLARFALQFGPAEMFLVAVAGLVVTGTLAARNVTKGLFGVIFGIALSTVGVDPMSGADRLVFGFTPLKAGISLIPVILGLFAIAEILTNSGGQTGQIAETSAKPTSIATVMRYMLKKWLLLSKSTLLGTFIGVVPGTGGAVATFISYAEAKRTSKDSGSFGQGNPEGIIAAESANNGAVGGSLVPLLALGIPGSATSAIMYGAITIHGLIAGPRLFSDHPVVAYSFMYGMLLTVIIMGIIGIAGIPLFSLIVKVKLKYLSPIVLAVCMFGAFSVNNRLFDVLVAIVFGGVGILFRKTNIPPATVVLGLILGPIVERNFRRVLTIAGARSISPLRYVLSSPLSLGILVVVVLLLVSFFRLNRLSRQQEVASVDE